MFGLQNNPYVDPFLIPCSTPHPGGNSLRHTPVYDQIREARREDDVLVSRGVWQYDLKRADWSLVAELSSNLLKNQSKDLQLAGWLGEAWLMLHGIQGFTGNLQLIKALCETFWDNLYPELDEEGTEFRSQFFDWYDFTLGQRIVVLPLLENSPFDIELSLSTWLSAQRFDKLSKQSGDNQRLLDRAIEKGQVTIARFHEMALQIPLSHLKKLKEDLKELRGAYESLKTSLNTLMPQSTTSFHELESVIRDFTRLINTLLDQRPSPSFLTSLFEDSQKEPDPTPISSPPLPDSPSPLTREKAYAQLSEIADFLEATEPHSLVPKALKRILPWQHRHAMDVLMELGSNPDELGAMMKFMGINLPAHTS